MADRPLTMPGSLKPDTGRAGIVLAGGRSERFDGGDKALASLAGKPLLAHVVDAVEPAVDDVLVSCRTDQRADFEAVLGDRSVEFVTDPLDDQGPVAGLHAALTTTERLTAVVAACDAPLIPAGFLAHLLDRVERSTTAAAAVSVAGRLEPLPVGLNVRAGAGACSEALDTGGALCDAVESLAPVVVPEQHVRAAVGRSRLLDIDTRLDLAHAEHLLARATTPPTGDITTPSSSGMRSNGR